VTARVYWVAQQGQPDRRYYAELAALLAAKNAARDHGKDAQVIRDDSEGMTLVWTSEPDDP
jgi:hypothetical protein